MSADACPPVGSSASPALPVAGPVIRRGRTRGDVCPHCGRSRRPRLMSATHVAADLDMTLKAFSQTYAMYFSDRRPIKRRTRGVPRLIPTDEVDLFISEGPEAVIDYRRREGRLTPDEERRLTDGLDTDGRPIRKYAFRGGNRDEHEELAGSGIGEPRGDRGGDRTAERGA